MPSATTATPLLPVLPTGSPPRAAAPQQRLRQACQDFESLFVYKLLEQLRATIPQEGYLHGAQEDVYQTICDQQVAIALAKSGGIGLGEMLWRQLSSPAAQPDKEKALKAYEAARPTQPSARRSIQELSRWSVPRSIRE